MVRGSLEEDLAAYRVDAVRKSGFGMIEMPEPPRLQIRVQRFASAFGLQRADAALPTSGPALIPGSSVVEQAAVNRWVDGSNPSRGANNVRGLDQNDLTL